MTEQEREVIIVALMAIGSVPKDRQVDVLAAINRIFISDDGSDLQEKLRRAVGVAHRR